MSSNNFRFDGRLIYPYNTVNQLEMEDGDIIGKYTYYI